MDLTEKDISDPALADALSRLREVCEFPLVSGAFDQLFEVFACVLSGADVQCSRREEKPRALCD